MRNGDFSSILPYGYVIYDPNSRSLGTSTVAAQQLASVVATQSPFPGNIIPASRISPRLHASAQQVGSVAESTQTTAGLPFNNYQYGLKIPLDKDTLTDRIDFNESSKSQWFGRYSWNDESTLENTGQITDDGETLYTRASQWVLSNVRTISPTKVNEARFGYNSLFNNITQQLAGKENVKFVVPSAPGHTVCPSRVGEASFFATGRPSASFVSLHVILP